MKKALWYFIGILAFFSIFMASSWAQSVINPKTGEFYPNVGGGVINPKSGEFFPDVGGGAINPKTGSFYPHVGGRPLVSDVYPHPKRMIILPDTPSTPSDDPPGRIQIQIYEDWLGKASAVHTAGKHKEAIDAYNKAVELNPKDERIYYNRGLAYSQIRDHLQAIRDYDKAIDLNPTYGAAYYNRGVNYSNLGIYHQAIDDHDKAIELNPTYGAYNNRGVAFQELGDHQQAIKNYTRAIQLNSNLAGAYYNRGRAYKTLGDHQLAIRDCESASRLGYKPAQNYLRSQTEPDPPVYFGRGYTGRIEIGADGIARPAPD